MIHSKDENFVHSFCLADQRTATIFLLSTCVLFTGIADLESIFGYFFQIAVW